MSRPGGVRAPRRRQKASGPRDAWQRSSVALPALAPEASALPIRPVDGPLDAVVSVPGSKSLTNRALVAAALADGRTRLTGALVADDTRRMAESIRRIGIAVTIDEAAGTMTVEGLGGRIPAERASLDVGNAGTAARFLTAICALGRGVYVVDGAPRMRERPIGGLVAALRQLGATIACRTGCPPVRVAASGLDGGVARVEGTTSSQFLSAVLLAAPLARRVVDLRVEGALGSRPYVDLTLDTMEAFGVEVERHGFERFVVRPARYVSPGRFVVEADASAASYFFAAAAIAGGTVRVDGLDRRSRQGDVGFAEVLGRMGCQVDSGDGWIAVRRDGPLHGVEIDLGDMPDVAQTLAAVAPFGDSPTAIGGIASARRKECDRISAMAEALAALGVEVVERPDGLVVTPCPRLRPAIVKTHDDHRMAMAFALVGLRSAGVAIENPQCVAKTFPGYFDQLARLRSAPRGAGG